jgi:regulatory protein
MCAWSRSPRGPQEAAADPAACHEAALRLLDRARRTRSDLARRLRDQGFPAPAVEGVLDRLAAVGLLDDAEYARAYLAARWGRRPAGWRRLQRDLRARGVGDADLAQARAALTEREGAVDETEAARRVVAQAARRYGALEPRVRRQRLHALLQRRGFDTDTIRAVLALPLEPDEG